MKKFLLLSVLAALTSVLEAAPLTAGPNEGFVLLNNASVFKEKSMGTLEWSEALTLGDKVQIVGGVVKMKYSGNEREYYKVKLANGKEGFIRTILLGTGGTLGVVKAEASLVYSEPRDVKITARTLTRGQMVVVQKEGATDQFIKVVGYEASTDAPIDGVFLAKEDVSINDIDANAIILLTVAKAQKNEAVKKNLLTVAATKYSTSLFMDLVRAVLDPLNPAPRATKPASGTFLVNDNKVNVRDVPNEKGSKVVGSLEKGVSVEVVETTAESYTIEGKTAPWYRLASPDGWVFGSFLTAP